MEQLTLTKTYPPHVRALLDGYRAMIEQIHQQIFAPQPDGMTATMAAQAHRLTPDQITAKQREYQDAIAPIIKQMVELECFATHTIAVK